MKPERWKEIDRIFADALDREAEERSSFLDEACGDDSELRQEVESLLAHDQPNTIVGGRGAEEATQLLMAASGVGSDIGPYQVLRSLGAGGMGRVFLAYDKRLNRQVAVKLISQYSAAEDERVRRFQQEALAASALNHPNILTIYEIGEADGNNFIATEFVDGRTLRELIDTDEMPIDECLDIARQIATALSAAHAAGIVHRDIKPANIMIRNDGLVKVLDFGVAKFTQSSNSANSGLETMPGTVVGTAAYMSPEQARGNPVDSRSDIWSLGVILYEMLTRRRPFEGATALDLMSAVIERDPTSFVESGKAVPRDLEDIVFKTLEKDRERRYQSTSEVLIDLKELSKRLETTGTQDLRPNEHAATQRLEITHEPSIAVLPFVNMSAEPDNEYFCHGLSEELLNALAKIGDLKVAARTSAFSFKDKNSTVSEIGKALNVNSVLEGSVRKSGNRVRITAQLVNCSDGYHLWSERYDRELKDIFDVQDEITLAIVDALKIKLLSKEKDAILKRYTDNVEAYQLYLRGRYYWWKTTPQEFKKSREYFEQAVAADPTYALGYAGLSSYFGFGSAWGIVPPDIGWSKAIEANDRSLALDSSLPEVQANTGAIYMVHNRDFVAAEQNIKRSIEFNPGFQEAHYIYSFYLAVRGRSDEAITEAQQALELDPFSVRLNHHLGNTYYLARRYDEAIIQYNQAVELDSNNRLLHESLGDAYEQKGMNSQAISEWQNAMKIEGTNEGAELLSRVNSDSGFTAAVLTLAQSQLEQLERKVESGEYVPAIHFARAYTKLDNREKAFEWLERACVERNVFPLLIQADPLYDKLRSEARFTTLLGRFNLDETQFSQAPKAATTQSPKSVTTTEVVTAQNGDEQTVQIKKPAQRRALFIAALIALVLAAVGLLYWRYSSRLAPIESIAVLPFKNESNNSEVEYLSDGMTDTLINSLSQLPHLSVKARSSVFRYKGRDVEPQRIASELSVQAILNGRVRQHGDDLTISISLVDANSGNQIWGQNYDRKLSQLVTLQSEITRDVVQKLRVRLSSAEEQKIKKDYTANAEAYQLYLKGRFHVSKLVPQEVQLGIKDFQQAIELDPNYALAYVGLSEANRSLALGSEMNPSEYLPRAKAAAQKALELDEELAESHTAFGSTIFWYERNWNEAENQYKRALELNPKSPDAHLFYAHLLSLTGRHEEAISEIKRARELEPLSPFINTLEGQFLGSAGRNDEALARLRETFALAPGFWFPHIFASNTYIEKGMFAEAITEAKRATELSSAQTYSVTLEGYALAKLGRTDEARVILDRLLKLSQERFVPPYHIAVLYNALGNTDETIAWLHKGFDQHDPKLAFLKVEPKWNNLRAEPRFQEIMRRAGF